jgi:hypothetical protein
MLRHEASCNTFQYSKDSFCLPTGRHYIKNDHMEKIKIQSRSCAGNIVVAINCSRAKETQAIKIHCLMMTSNLLELFNQLRCRQKKITDVILQKLVCMVYVYRAYKMDEAV